MNRIHGFSLRVLTAGLLALPFGPSSAPAQETGTQKPFVLTLEKALSLAQEQNRDVLIAEQERYRADAQISEARSGAFPQITVSGQYSRFLKKPVLFIPPNSPINPSSSTVAFELGSDNAYQGGATLSQALYNKRVGVAMDIAHTYHDFAEEGYRATSEDVALQVKRAFYGVLLTQKLVEANREGLDVVRANYENVQSQFKHGAAAEFDLLRAEVQLANTEPMVISAENNLLLATNALKSLLALPLESPVVVQGEFTFTELPAEAIVQRRQEALKSNPSLVQLSLQESMLEQNITVEKANYFPALNLFGSYQWQAQDNTFRIRDYLWANTVNVGLQISFPLFDGFKTSARVQQAEIEWQKLKYTRLKAEEGVKIQVQSAELRMTEATKRIQGQEKNISQAEKALQIAQTRFKSGVGTQLELLDTQVAMTRARTNYAQAIYDYLIARAEWQRAVGQGE